jgi:GntR family transcriptional regulator/MocR family aminotransferase
MQIMTYNPSSPSKSLPVEAWTKAMLKHAADPANQINDDPFGYKPLRQAIADYLKRTRGICAAPERIILFSRSLQPLNFITRLLLSEGDKAIVENPGFRFAGQTFASQGACLEPIDIDGEGIKLDLVTDASEHAKIIYLSPSHQNPTGVRLSAQRRNELLHLANGHMNGHSCFIIEDDTDCEYNYHSTNLPALISSDTNDGVIYYNSFWKTLSPLVDIGYLILPEILVDEVSHALINSAADEGTALSLIEQKALCDFLNEGQLEKNIEENKPVFYQAYQNLHDAFDKQFGSKIEFSPEPSGLHTMLTFKTTKSDTEIVNAAHRAALPLLPTSDYYYEHKPTRQYIVPFAELLETDCDNLIHTFFTELHR